MNALFFSAGAPGEPPLLAHNTKWKEWLFRAGQDPNVDSLAVLGSVLEEFMDVAPRNDPNAYALWKNLRDAVEAALADNGLRYFRFGCVLPQGSLEPTPSGLTIASNPVSATPCKPAKVEELIEVLIKGLRRAMHPLTHRRKGAQPLSFANEYDMQDLLHALLRPWIQDIRPEEHTPSYAGSSTRMDFLLPAHKLVIETKYTRDQNHAKKIGDELIIDIAHYRKHQDCRVLWCVIYDPNHFIVNPEGLCGDLESSRTAGDGEMVVRVFVLQQ
ncbi:MAG: hypothetical protein JNM11_01800 [Chitinimonas sp.]|nr:hypothetical protein [Chitinimonas sp.]